jgi:hypothetical protein
MIGTHTGLWRIIAWWNRREIQILRHKERMAARERELAAARERIRRDQSAAAFDRKIALLRKKSS